MKKIKLVSDFDGIWTNQNIEAEYVWNYLVKTLSGLTGFDTDKTQNILNDCKNEMDKEPYKYGWFNNGKIAAYFREDPFGDNNAIFDYIDKNANDNSDLLLIKNQKSFRDSILKKHSSLADFSQECFMMSTKKFKEDGMLNPIDKTKSIVGELNLAGIDIIIASNSRTEKIKYLFSKIGIEVTDESDSDRGGVHARGDAQKFVIDNNYEKLPEYLEIAENYKVPLRRSNYHKILSEEKPDFVIGDVFSLDIALPLYLRMNDNAFSNLKVIQRIQPYTPGWVKNYLNKSEHNGVAFTVDSVNDLPKLLKGLI